LSGEHALAGDAGDDLLEAARVGRRSGDHLDPPALRFGVALVHPEQVAREQCRLVATGAGADLEHRRALVGGIARQQREREFPIGGFQQRAVLVQLVRRHRAEFVVGIVGHEREALRLLPQPAHFGGGLGDGFELGIFLRHRDEAVRGEVAGRHERLQLVTPRLDRADAVGGDLGHEILPGTGRGTARRGVEGAGRRCCATWKPPSVSAAHCHLPVPGRICE